MRAHAGFTIIEVLTALTIIGILAAIGIPAVKSFGRSTDVVASAKQVVADMWLARQKAIATSNPYSVLFEPDQRRYFVFSDDGNGVPANAANGSIDSGEVIATTRSLRRQCAFSDVDLDPANVVIFVPKGTLKNGTGGGSVTITDEGKSKTVLIRASGLCKAD